MSIKQGVLSSIKWYQHSASLRHTFFKVFFLSDSTCSFSPTCSEYFYQAIEKYGLLKGFYLGIRRILRCHPFSSGGIDPVR